MSRALVLTYHAIDDGEGALFVDAASFASHLDVIVESGADVVTISELAETMRAGALRRPAVAVTFDDGMASVARTAAPLLLERGLSATVFCVAGHLGRTTEWESARPGSPPLELGRADEWAVLAQQGIEIGCHGMTHAPLDAGSDGFLRRELIEAKERLEQEVQTPVRAYAYPYGATPTAAAHALVKSAYDSAWTTRAGYLGSGDELHRGPRVDAHYLRRPALLRAALAGSLSPYLRVRRFGAQARRALRRDYSPVGGTT